MSVDIALTSLDKFTVISVSFVFTDLLCTLKGSQQFFFPYEFSVTYVYSEPHTNWLLTNLFLALMRTKDHHLLSLFHQVLFK